MHEEHIIFFYPIIESPDSELVRIMIGKFFLR